MATMRSARKAELSLVNTPKRWQVIIARDPGFPAEVAGSDALIQTRDRSRAGHDQVASSGMKLASRPYFSYNGCT